MHFTKGLATVAVCGGGLVLASSAQALIIDNFDSGPGIVDSIGDPGPTNFASGDAIGGSRTLEILGFPGNGDPISSGAELQVAVPPGAIGHSQDAFAPGGRSKVTWDANGAGLGGLDLTDGGLANGIEFELISIDVGAVDVTITVVDSGGDSSDLLLSPLVVGSNQFFFADFNGTADFADADMIMMNIDADQASDLILDIIQTIIVPPPPPGPALVPEPITASLGMMSMGALAYATKRRKA